MSDVPAGQLGTPAVIERSEGLLVSGALEPLREQLQTVG